LLKEVYLDALRHHQDKVGKLKDSNYSTIMDMAGSRWVAYSPKPRACVSAGIDSSWNKRAFQGLSLYAVDAVAVTSSNRIKAVEYELDLADSARGEALETKAMAMEASVASRALKDEEDPRVDIAFVDGSLIPRLRGKSPAAVADYVEKYGNSVFVSKSSESRAHFGALGSRAGDIYYYGHSSKDQPGYSTPVYRTDAGTALTEIYARLRKSTPVVRLEILGRQPSEAEVQKTLDMLCYHSVSGYPYCLKLAHNNCKISDEEMERLAGIFGLQHEPGARLVLNE